MSAAGRIASIDQITLGDELWANARGRWRRARVVAIARKRVTIAFRLGGLNAGNAALRIQWVPVSRLRERSWQPPPRCFYNPVRPPTDEELRHNLALEAGGPR